MVAALVVLLILLILRHQQALWQMLLRLARVRWDLVKFLRPQIPNLAKTLMFPEDLALILLLLDLHLALFGIL